MKWSKNLLVTIFLILLFALRGTTPGLAQSGRNGTYTVKTNTSNSAFITEDLSGPLTPTDLANNLVGSGVVISNVTYGGVDESAGLFSGGAGIIGFDSGIILSSGNIANVIGPNLFDDITATNGTPGDTDLDILSGYTTYDATILEFDFVPITNTISFNYVFASDEYNEWVHTQYNDVFAFFVNGTNCATVNGDPVSINTINNGRPYGTPPMENPSFYINNDLDDGGGSIDTEMDGLTVVLTCQATVSPGVINHIKLAIADASDSIWDSNVFLENNSFISGPTPTPTPTETPTSTSTPTPTFTPTQTPTPTSTPTHAIPTSTSTYTPTPTPIVTSTPTRTPISTLAVSPTPTRTPVSTLAVTSTPTRTPISTLTVSPTPTRTPVSTLAVSPTPTRTPISTLVVTPTPTNTPVFILTTTPIPTRTPVSIVTPTPPSSPTPTPIPPPSVPEPITVVLFGSGVAAMGAYIRKRKKDIAP